MKSGLLVAADLYGCAEDTLVQEALKKVLEDYAENIIIGHFPGNRAAPGFERVVTFGVNNTSAHIVVSSL